MIDHEANVQQTLCNSRLSHNTRVQSVLQNYNRPKLLGNFSVNYRQKRGKIVDGETAAIKKKTICV